MSAFICSDNHISTISSWYSLQLDLSSVGTQINADKLKIINVSSVNYRYNEKIRCKKCDISNSLPVTNPNDILRLIDCLDYQSCEKPNYKNPLLKSIRMTAEQLLSAETFPVASIGWGI